MGAMGFYNHKNPTVSVIDCPLNCYIKPFSGNRRQFKTLSLLQTQFVNLSLNARPNNVNDSEKKATTRYGHSAGCRHFTSFSILIVHGLSLIHI